MTRTKIPFHFSMFATAVLVAACGGGDATAPGGSTTSSSGFAVDGYLNGATVVCDANGNGLADSGERTVISDSSGFFRFTPSCESALIATGGTSVDTGLAFTGTLRAPSGATVITPLTTLIASGMSESKLKEVLGISNTDTGSDSLLTIDPARTSAGALMKPDLMKKTLVLQQLAQKITEVVAGLATSGGDAARAAIYSEVMAALAQALATNPALITGSTMSESVTQALVKAAAQRVAASTTLPAGVKAGVAALNADSLAQVIAGALKAQGETILGASGDTLTAKTKTAQESTAITSFVQTNKANSALTGAPTAATNTLATSLKDTVSGTVTPPNAGGDTDLLNFDTLLPLTAAGGEGGEGSGLVAAPQGGGSGQAYRVLRSGGQPYALAVLEKTVPFTADRKTIVAQVFSPAAGIRMVVKMEGAAGLNTGEVEANEAVVAGWQTLSWTFASADPTKTYNKMVLLPRLGTVDAPPGQSYYFDNIQLKAAVAAPPATGSDTNLLNFDTLSPTSISAEHGAQGSGLMAPPSGGGSGQAYRVLRSGGETYALVVMKKVIPFAADRKTVSAMVHSPTAGIPIKIKLEAGNVNSGEVASNEAVVAGWQTLTWTFTSVNPALNWDTIVLLPNIGTVDAVPGKSYFFDDFKLLAAGAGGGSGSGSGSDSGPGGNPDAAMGSGGAQTMALATANDPHGLYVTGNGIFAGDYIGTKDANNNSAGWLNAATRGTARNGDASKGNIGYYQDTGLSTSAQKIDENGWVTGNIDNEGGVPGFFRYVVLRGPASTFTNSFMGLYVNARNNGTVDVSGYANVKFKVWGPAEMYQNNNLNPQLEMIFVGPKVPGCNATGSGGTEIKKTFTANQKIGAGSSYTISLAGSWTVVGVCGTDTANTAKDAVFGKLARVVFNVPGSSFNFTNANPGGVEFSTGINLGPIAFTQ